MILPPALAPLCTVDHWLVWRWEVTKFGDKPTKVPYQSADPRWKASSKDPSTWSSYAAAIATCDDQDAQVDGIGFCLQDSGLGAFDIDDCRDPKTGVLHPWAQRLIERAASYAEITVSGTGIRIIGQADGPAIHRKQTVADGVTIETYRRATRYIVVTGHHLEGSPSDLANIDEVMDEVVSELDAAKPKKKEPRKSTGDKSAIPAVLRSLLYVPGSGGYPTRSELLFAFITSALRHRVSDEAIISACLDEAYRSGGIFEHCNSNGGSSYIARQIAHAREKKIEAGEKLTDLGNAKRLVRLYGYDLRYVHAWCQWLVWRDGRWHRDDDGGIARLAKATVEEMFTEAATINDDARRSFLRVWALRSQQAQRLAAMIKLAESEPEVIVSVDQIDADPYLLGVKNGVIDLRTCTFREARREDYVTKFAGVAFDPDAKCPSWLAFLQLVTPGEELANYLQRVSGYTLTGLTVEEVLFVLLGIGANGKSTFRETIYELLGDYAVSADASMLVSNKRSGGATPDLAHIHGRRLLTINETQQNDVLNEARVKFITSHDTISARNLYEKPFDFLPTHKAFITTNHQPIIRGSDDGIWRRIHLLPFSIQIPPKQRDVHFRDKKLKPELSGILNWALEGLRCYHREGLKPPPLIVGATEEYRSEMDLIGGWIEERCIRDPEARLRTSKLHADYAIWAKQEVSGYSMSVPVFGRELNDRGFPKCKVEGQRGTRGLRLVPLPPPEPPY